MLRLRFALFVGIALAPGAACMSDGPLSGSSDLPSENTQGPADGSTTVEPAVSQGTTAAVSQPADEAAVEDELMARWNAAAASVHSAFDFQWRSFNQFPHPTFKGGSALAYQSFATVLLAFFQRGDDFDFLSRNHLFTLSLVYVFPSGANGFETTFQSLAASFSSPNGFGDIAADTRQSLQGFLNRMQ